MSTKAKHPRVSAFAPVPLRRRAKGWTPAKQAAFLAQLALTGNVRLAARRVRMSRETAYRLRNKPGGEGFADAWDRLTGKFSGRPRKVTHRGWDMRENYGLLKPLIYRGRHTATVRKDDNSAIYRAVARLRHIDAALATSGPPSPLSFHELCQPVAAASPL